MTEQEIRQRFGSPAVEIRGLVKDYPMLDGRKSKLRQLLAARVEQHTFRALNGIDATFLYGQRIGLCGLNGSGKSTLSTIIAGISRPTQGEVLTHGSTSMLNPSLGLNPNMTGREAIAYKCLLLGFTHDQIAAMEQDIIDFADIGIFIDQPIRAYSSGMRARLGFAISVQLRPDILIVDEALAVGDDSFVQKCYEWMDDFTASGRCIILVSHSLQVMRNFCQRVMWLHRGEQVVLGSATPVLDAYGEFSRNCRKLNEEQQISAIRDYKARLKE